MVLIPKIYHAKHLIRNRVSNLGETRVGLEGGGGGGGCGVPRKKAVTQF